MVAPGLLYRECIRLVRYVAVLVSTMEKEAKKTVKMPREKYFVVY